jgi:3-hydroxyacyl-[acyl-carrier-protein] dehydratase
VNTALTTRSQTVIEHRELVEYLPHRFPFLLVDRVIDHEPFRRIRGIKNIPVNDAFLPGERGAPYPPGLIVESIGQLGILLYNLGRGYRGKDAPEFLLGSLRGVSFLEAVPRGRQMLLEARVVRELSQGLVYEGWAEVEGRTVTTVQEMVAVVRGGAAERGPEGGDA